MFTSTTQSEISPLSLGYFYAFREAFEAALSQFANMSGSEPQSSAEGSSSLGGSIAHCSPQFPLQSSQEARSNLEKLNVCLRDLSNGAFEPIKHVLWTPIEEASRQTKWDFIKKIEEAAKIIADTAAPGQGDRLVTELCKTYNDPETSDADNATMSPEMYALSQAIRNVTSRPMRRALLSVFADTYSKSELLELIPGSTKNEIDQARHHAKSHGAGEAAFSKKKFFERIPRSVLEDFLSFVNRPEFTQDSPFGKKSITLGNGEKIEIPDSIRKALKSDLVSRYRAYCSEKNIFCPSESTLFRILRVLKASQQKCLAGIDSVTAAGSDGFSSMKDIVQVLGIVGKGKEWETETLLELRKAKTFLKTEFSQKLSVASEFACHCSTYGLSDPDEQLYQTECNHVHDKVCDKCEHISRLFTLVRQDLDDPDLKWQNRHQKSDLIAEMGTAVSAVDEWRAHLMRSFHQNLAKNEFFENMTDTQSYIIMDWATKFLPARFREKQIDFFGKRGKPWHGICIFLKQSDELKVQRWFMYHMLLQIHFLETSGTKISYVHCMKCTSNTHYTQHWKWPICSCFVCTLFTQSMYVANKAHTKYMHP